MTRNYQGNRIRRARLCNRARRRRCPIACATSRRCVSRRTESVGAPAIPAGRRSPDVERQFEIRFATIEIRENGADPRVSFRSCPRRLGARNSRSARLEHCGVIAEGDAQTPLGRRNEQRPRMSYGDVGDATPAPPRAYVAGSCRAARAMLVDALVELYPASRVRTHVLPPFQSCFERAVGAPRVGPRLIPELA